MDESDNFKAEVVSSENRANDFILLLIMFYYFEGL